MTANKNLRHVINTLILMTLISLAAPSCNQQNNQTQNGEPLFSYTDPYNNHTELYALPQRIVSVSPGVSEILCGLGQTQRIVGRTMFCTNPMLQNVENIGGISDANIEKIISLNPDVVVTASMFNESAYNRLKQVGIPVIILPEGKEVESVYFNIQTLAQLTDCPNRADSMITEIKKSLANLPQLPTRPTVYYVAGFGAGGDFTAGGNTFINNIIELAGGKNIAQDIQGWSFSKEMLFAHEPDVIFVRHEDLSKFTTTAPYNNLSAVKKGNVYGINSTLIDVQSQHSAQAVHYMAEKLREAITKE